MSEKSDLQQPLIKYLQDSGIDFLHMGNAGFGGKRRAYNTKAFIGDGVINESIACDKYFPDLIFPHSGFVYMVEFGVPGAHTDRKAKQMQRMSHWRDNGMCITLLITERKQVDRLIEKLSGGSVCL